MTRCLLSLGSNVRDREATLGDALDQIAALPNLQVVRRSAWHRSQPVGGPLGQGEFLNAVAVVETTIPPLSLLDELQDIESRHGRQRVERWGPRTLDIDILLYGNEVAETPMLTLPHPRMSFRRFVLQPAAEVAPRMLHPVIGWPVERLLLHVDAASNQAVILSPSESLRRDVAAWLNERLAAKPTDRPQFATADTLWPPATATWLDLRARSTTAQTVPSPTVPPYAAAAFPKLTVLLDTDSPSREAFKPQWSAIVRRPGRGPTLRLQTADQAEIQEEVFAAFDSVWPI